MSISVLPPDAPFTPEELAEAEDLQRAFDAKHTDSEDAAWLHELRALYTESDLREAEHEAMIAAALGQAEAAISPGGPSDLDDAAILPGGPSPSAQDDKSRSVILSVAKDLPLPHADGSPDQIASAPMLRLLRGVSYAVVPTLAAAATVMFVIRGREAQAPASAMSETMAAPTATAAAPPALETKAAATLDERAAKREEADKNATPVAKPDPNAPTAPWGEPAPPWEKMATGGNYAKPPPPERIGDSVPGGGARGTGLGYGAGAGSGAGAGGGTGGLAGKAYAEAPRARVGAAASSKGALGDSPGDYELKDNALGAAASAPGDDRAAAGDKLAEAKAGPARHGAPTVPAAQAAPAAPVARAKSVARAPQQDAPNVESSAQTRPSAERAASAKPTVPSSCTATCKVLTDAQKRLDANCKDPKTDARACADQRAWLKHKFEEQARDCGICK